ncbi:MAG TPA: glycoside hydrolase family 3 N-terminal domain-containing protein, partial [Bacillota bacterium]|nr:glycoside hydrolase family 3 N-terminal domain-containing protein [Bacillota bacterium]
MDGPEIDEKIAVLLKEMTLEEKIGQMVYLNFGYQEPLDAIRRGEVGLIANVKNAERMNRLQKIAVHESRLGIPILFGNDVLHGFRTIFPIPLAEACSWDPRLYEETANWAAKEASATGTQLIFAP